MSLNCLPFIQWILFFTFLNIIRNVILIRGSRSSSIWKGIIKTSMKEWMRVSWWRNQIWGELSCGNSNFLPHTSSTEAVVSWITIISGVETECSIVCFQEKVTFEKPFLKEAALHHADRHSGKETWWVKTFGSKGTGGVCGDVPLWCGKVALEKSGCVCYWLPVILYLLPSLCYLENHRGHKREGKNWGKS